MTSSILAGEKRWASARRGGMTVLGKVAVPKPLNLPSQRLENHGLDPNVEIVPKGTLSWGNRASSSASNAWGSSILSPNADGGTSSPSHLSGHPSSGSGSRPSTACSERSYEPTSNAWGQNSRPSSASGALTSNQTVLTSRPRSAETRPSSSQLSRFAEPPSDNSVAWGPTGVSEKLGVASSKNGGFSLSSGDFPTLGSERENSGKNTESQGDISVNANVKSGTVNTWGRDGSQHVEDWVQPTVEKWQREPPPYLNANVPPQHFDAWHGPPINPPPSVWYGGPPGRPPYATPLAPGGFPIEPFPYYRPQIPPAALANPQPVPPPGVGQRGHHPKNGDIYRPHIPDAYIRPGMPIRPGFYPGSVAYEGYYGPPMGYCNPNERDITFMGMAAGPSVYNRYSGENAPDPDNNHAGAILYGSTGKTSVSDQVESGHPDDIQGPYKVLLKQHNEWDEKRADDKCEHAVPANAPYLRKGDQPRISSQKNEWGLEDRKDEEIHSGRRVLSIDASSQKFDNRGICSSDSAKVELPENRGKAKAVGDSLVNKLENAASKFPQESQVHPTTPKDPMLRQKIEGLNAKARASDGQPDAASGPRSEEQKSRSQVVDAKANHFMNEAGTGAVCFERNAGGNHIPVSHDVDFYTAGVTSQPATFSGTANSRRASHGVQGKLDHRGKRFNTQDADEWRKKTLFAESTSAVLAANSEPSSNAHVKDHLPSFEAAEKCWINLQGKDRGESLIPAFDPSDCPVQHAKMREIVKQRAIELQKEEEERTREQKAKALAKLEELNRRTMDGSSQMLEKAPASGPIQRGEEKCQLHAEQVMVESKSETPSSALFSNRNAQIRESAIGVGESTVLFTDTLLETSDNVQPEYVLPHDQPLPLQQDAHSASAADYKAAPQVHEGSVSRHKCMGYKQKENTSLGKTLSEKSVPISPTEGPKDHADVAVNDVASTEVVTGKVGPCCESGLPMNSSTMSESSAHQRKKNNRNSKNKHKLDDMSSITHLPSEVPKETIAEQVSTESEKLEASELELDAKSVQSRTDAKQAIQHSEQHPSLSSEEASGRVNNQWKSQHSRRMPRNQKSNRMTEKFHTSDAVIWAPVWSQNKTEVIDENSNKTVPDTVNATAKGDSVVHNNLKSKRAEMERYVPKPVAKEMAQQGCIQPSVLSSFSQTSLDDTVGRAETFQNIESSQPGNSEIGTTGSTVESKNWDGKQNKQSKAHGSWRHRGSVESAIVQGLQDLSSSTSNPSKSIQRSIEKHPSLKPDVNSTEELKKSSDDWNTSDGCNTPENSDTTAPVTSAVVKDQGVAGRGKRHPFRGHRSMGNDHDHDHDHWNVYSGDTDKNSSETPAAEIGQTDKSIPSKENRWVGERKTSHWQPKSLVYSVHNQRGNRPGGGQNVTAEVSDAFRKDSVSQERVHLPPHHNKESREHMLHPPIDQSLSEQKNMAETPNVGHQEPKRERKIAPFRGHPHFPNQSSVNTVELAPPTSMDTQTEQRFSTGFRKNGNQNNRSGRGHDSRGDWSSAGQDNRQHNTSSNRERQRHNSHYEYQPIGQYNSNKSNNSEGLTDGSHNMGSRYRQRSQGHLRRGGGHFYGRQSETVHVDASSD